MVVQKSDENGISLRINKLIETLGYNVNSFSNAIGITNNVTIGRLIKENREPSYETLQKIVQTFGNVDANWLLTGEGEMYRNVVQGHVQDSRKRSIGEGFDGFISEPYSRDGEGIPFYDIEVSAGPAEMFSDQPEIPALKLLIPGFEDCDRAVPAWGQSMEPKYKSKDILLLKPEPNKGDVIYGAPYVIITPEKRLFKYIKKAEEKSNWLLASENKFFDPFELEIDSVLRVFFVKGSVCRNTIQ